MIPRGDREISIRTGTTGPQASPRDFGPDLSQVDNKLLFAAQHTNLAALNYQELINRQKTRDENRWLGESFEQEKNHLNEWMADPANHSKESFATDFLKYSKDRVSEYDKVAPSEDARDNFRSAMGGFISRKYEDALGIAEKTKQNNTIESVNKQISDALSGYHNAGGIPGGDNEADLVSSFGAIRQNINSQFHEFAPTLARHLQDNLTVSFALNVATDSPALARSFVDKSPDLNEHTRATLLNHISQQEKVKDQLGIDSFTRYRQDWGARVEVGKERGKIPLDLYQSFYPGDKAQVLKNQDDAYIDTAIKGQDVAAKLAPMAAGHQLNELDALYNGINSKEDQDVFKYVKQRVHKSIQLQDKNRVAWLLNNNPEVNAAGMRAAQAPESTRLQAITERNQAILKYQGPAPADATPEQAKWYLDVPSNDRHLMTLDEALQGADGINKGSAQEAIQNIQKVLTQYPDPQHQYIAFNDMATMPSEGKRLKQEYQAAFQNKDAWWIDLYLGAISKSKDIAKLTDEKKKELNETIDKQIPWNNFRRAMIGDDFSRAHEVEGFKNGISMFAEAMVSQGRHMKDAVKDATDKLIGESLGFTSINGQPLAILKERSNKDLPHRSDDDISDLGRRMTLALRDVDPRQIDMTPFRAVQKMDQGSVGQMQALRDQITSKGFFQTSNDGQSGILYMLDDLGFPFEVRDKNKNPLVIHFDEVPMFYSPSVLGSTYNKTESPSKTYPIVTPGNDQPISARDTGWMMWSKILSPGSSPSKTNWPSMPNYIRSK